MPTYATPGVYVEEVPARNQPIEGVSTSTAAFVGLAPGGPLNMPVQISNWSQFERTFSDPQDPSSGPFMEGAYLAHAVNGFFGNGGSLCWVVRIGHSNGSAPTAQAALPSATDPKQVVLTASTKDGVTDQVTVQVSLDPPQARPQVTDGSKGAAARSKGADG